MKRIIFSVTAALLVAGCPATNTPTPVLYKTCPGSNGPDVTIKYGDSYITVTDKVTVKDDGKIVLKLFPQNNPPGSMDYKNLEIELKGKTATDDWLDRKLKSTDANNNKFIICVDGEAEGDYEYDVIVPGVGRIDPRVHVEK